MRLATGLAAALLLASGGAPALELALDPAGLDPPAQQRARDLLARAHERLPGRWQADPRRLTLRFDPGLPADIAGRHRRGQLRLSPELLEEAATATATATAHDLARATVLHEIAHAFDRGEGGGWSRQPAFRRLAGWDRRGANPYTLRSPDGYERHSPAEAFAVNLEWYLLDPRYPCRRPALAAWFRQQLGRRRLRRWPAPPRCRCWWPAPRRRSWSWKRWIRRASTRWITCWPVLATRR